MAKEEWEDRRKKLSQDALEAFTWAVRSGIAAGEARRALQNAILLALGSSKGPE